MEDEIKGLSTETGYLVQKFSDVLADWVTWLPSVGIAIVVVICCFLFANFIGTRNALFQKFTKSLLLADLIRQTTSLAVKIAGIVLGLQIVGAGSLVGAVLGAAGVLGLGISFAFKDIVENYIAGILLSIRQPFNKGDHLIIDSFEGIVQRMTTRMTMIKSFDGNNISIPNAKVFQSSIINYSKHPHRRFSFQVGIHPEANPNSARKLGLVAMQDVPSILDSPAPFALIDTIADSSIVLSFFGWMDQVTDDFGQVRSLAISEVKDAIEAAGIEIPDPSYIVRLKEEAAKPVKAVDTSIETQSEELISTKRKEVEVVKKHREEEGQSNLLDSQNTE